MSVGQADSKHRSGEDLGDGSADFNGFFFRHGYCTNFSDDDYTEARAEIKRSRHKCRRRAPGLWGCRGIREAINLARLWGCLTRTQSGAGRAAAGAALTKNKLDKPVELVRVVQNEQ